MDKATNTITLDGVQHNVADFSQSIQQAVGIYNTFNADLAKSQLEVIKNQSALQSVGAQIAEAVKKELAAKEAAAADAVAADAANDAVVADVAPAV